MELSGFIDRWRSGALRAAAGAIAPGVASTLIDRRCTLIRATG